MSKVEKNERLSELQDTLTGTATYASLKKYLEAEYDRAKENLVKNNTDENVGKARQLQELLKDLFRAPVDTQ